MLIKDVMTANPACCKPSDSIADVARLMIDHDCGIVPVCDGANVVGVITDRDLACRAVAYKKNPSTTTADDVMTRGAFIISDNAHLGTALELMQERLVRRLLVLDAIGNLVGVVSEADLVARVGTLKVARALKTVAKRTRRLAFANL